MTIPNRTVSIKSVFASTANTTIPTPPAPGVSYRNTGTTAAEIGEGWPFKEVVDSAKFNQAMYEYTTICQQVEKYGFLPWSANTDYPAQGCALGSDGKIYQAKQATGPSSTSIEPTTDTSHTYWDLFYYAEVTANRALVSNANGKMAASSVTATELGYVHGVTSSIQTQINNRAPNNAVVHLTGNETIAGSKTFSSSPSVPTATNGDNSTKAATTAFVQTAVNTRATQEDVNLAISNVLSALYPVGSIYIGTQNTCPLATLISGSTWELVATNRALWGGDGTNAHRWIAAGLPNITGSFEARIYWGSSPVGITNSQGAFGETNAGAIATPDGGGDLRGSMPKTFDFNASRSSSIYGNSNTVQPPAYVVNVWRRTA